MQQACNRTHLLALPPRGASALARRRSSSNRQQAAPHDRWSRAAPR
jgi:hypothetical protein